MRLILFIAALIWGYNHFAPADAPKPDQQENVVDWDAGTPIPQADSQGDASPSPPPELDRAPTPEVFFDPRLAALGAAIERAAEQAETPKAAGTKPTLLLFSATWCGPCQRHKAMVDGLNARGEVVWVYDHDKDQRQFTRWNVTQMPTWIRVEGAKEIARVPKLGADSFTETELQDLLKIDEPLAGSSMFAPTIRLADGAGFVTGKTYNFGDSVSLDVPADCAWTTQKRQGSVLLTFIAGEPSLSIRKFIHLNPHLVSIEISPLWVEIKTDSLIPPLRTIRCDIDWTSPNEVPAAGPTEMDGKPIAMQVHARRKSRGPPRAFWDRPLVRVIRFAGSVCSILKFVILL